MRFLRLLLAYSVLVAGALVFFSVAWEGFDLRESITWYMALLVAGVMLAPIRWVDGFDTGSGWFSADFGDHCDWGD